MRLKLKNIHEAVTAVNEGLKVECFLVIGEDAPATKGKRRRTMITNDNTTYSFHGATVPDLMPGSDIAKACETLMNSVFKGNKKLATRAEITAQLAKSRKWRKQRSISNIANLRKRDILQVEKL
jgi:hypothetical protein